MIGDLIEYGKWLSNNDLDDFGKDTKDADYIFPTMRRMGSVFVRRFCYSKNVYSFWG